MLELPTPMTKEECREQAGLHAAYLLAMPRIRSMARLRLGINSGEHPEWLISWLDDEIARIKFRIEILHEWSKPWDPARVAERIRGNIVQVDYIMRLMNGSTCSAPVNAEINLAWLKGLLTVNNDANQEE